jgi:hypothetical protein
MMLHKVYRLRRQGTILPLVAISLLALLGLVALAVDIGMIASARAQAQRACDLGALAGSRTYNGNIPSQNNKANAFTAAQSMTSANKIFGTAIGASASADCEKYAYDGTTGFVVSTGGGSGVPATSPWTAMICSTSAPLQPYFAVYNMSGGVGNYSGGYTISTTACSVHRPRDIGIILDFSGSMAHNSEDNFNIGNGAFGGNYWSMSADPDFPQWGHWSVVQAVGADGPLYRNTALYYDGSTYTYSQSNQTRGRDYPGFPNNDPAIVLDFFYDATNVSTVVNADGSTTKISTAGVAVDASNLKSAFCTFATTPLSINASGLPTPAVGDATPNNAAYDNTVLIAQPAPSTFATQNNGGVANKYDGDYWPASGGTKKLALGGGPYAKNVQDFLGSAAYSAVWESGDQSTVGGYDIATNKPAGWKFKGYSVGPGYWGKTFWMWPPDPRTPIPSVDVNGNPINGASGKISGGDWRQRFFLDGGAPAKDNSKLFGMAVSGGAAANLQRPDGTTSTTTINYAAVLAWIKSNSNQDSGPCVFPPNLRAGRLLYYSSIPSNVNFASPAVTPLDYDKMFWKNYIDYVLGNPQANRGNTGGTNSGSTPNSIYGWEKYAWRTNGTAQITATAALGGPPTPYMSYTDVPIGPRGHFWFGPRTMLSYFTRMENGYGNNLTNWLPGTSHEAQNWQVKAGVAAGLQAIYDNHPNDLVALDFFSSQPEYSYVRVPLGTSYTDMADTLYYPYELIMNNPSAYTTAVPNTATVAARPTPNNLLASSTSEYRPYDKFYKDTTFGRVANGSQSTCPAIGFKVIYNEFSSAAGYNGRKGAKKIAIFETDGFPNTIDSNRSNAPSGGGPGQWSSLYTTPGGGYGAGVNQQSYDVVTTLCASVNAAGPLGPGYTAGGSTAEVHCIAFGDMFDPTYGPPGSANGALAFLGGIQQRGNSDYTAAYPYIDPSKVVYGSSSQRAQKLQTALQNILQSGIQITLKY